MGVSVHAMTVCFRITQVSLEEDGLLLILLCLVSVVPFPQQKMEDGIDLLFERK